VNLQELEALLFDRCPPAVDERLLSVRFAILTDEQPTWKDCIRAILNRTMPELRDLATESK
jgi:hypothetical protein